ncbi:MAG: helicase HerA domain-containing protein, partial [Anaerolineales bacterium]
MTVNKIDSGLLQPILRMGVVSSVNANVARINLKEAGAPSGTYYQAGRYGRGEVGEFVLIEGQQNLILGRVVEIRLPERDRRTVTQDYAGGSELDAIGHVQLLGSVSMADNLAVTAGVDYYPRLGDRVYAAPHQFVALIPTLMEAVTDGDSLLTLELGSVGAAHESTVTISPEKLFGRHCAILGATGGGKSWTTARIIEECLEHESKIILLDPSGEYRGINGDQITHCHLGSPIHKADGSKSSSLPAACFQETDF